MKQYAVIGAGYVGLDIALALSNKNTVMVYDINRDRIDELQHYVDSHSLVNKDALSNSNISYTTEIQEIKSANIFIISVPTPLDQNQQPDLQPLKSAMDAISSVICTGDIIIIESTVYPGTTEEICVPLLEEKTQLKNGVDFFVGYSPERISPGDPNYTLKNLTKIIAAQDKATLNVIQTIYKEICDKVYPVSNIKTAEAIKLLENTQRDVNIALMNEFSHIMHKLDLNMHEIIEGAKTKKGFMAYKPGLVGGHCIPVDPLYMAFKAKQHGVNPLMIEAARSINNGMTQLIIQSLLVLLKKHKFDASNLTIGLYGVTYKENVPDTRNSLGIKLLNELKEHGFTCLVHDPLVDEVGNDIELVEFHEMKTLSVLILLVGHDYYKKLGFKKMREKCKTPCILMDIPSLFVKEADQSDDLIYWQL